MPLYDDFQGLANDLLGEYGSGDAYLVSVTPGGYNPATGKHVGGSQVDIPINAVFMPVKAWRIDGENVIAGDLVVKAGTANLNAAPKVGDKVKRGAEVYSVLGVGDIKPADTTILFDLHVRAD